MIRVRSILIGTVVAALFATGCEWNFETLDGNGGPNGRTAVAVGWWNSAILVGGLPHVFYENRTDHSLRHAYFG